MTETLVAFDDGSTANVEAWGERGPVIVCVHGIASSRRSWARLGEGLSGTARVFAYDQRGHGDRAGTGGPMTLERSVADLETVAASLSAPVDVLVGHSWGGAVVVLGGPRVRPRRGVIAVDPMLRVAPHTFETEYVDDLRATLALEPVAKQAAIRETYAGGHPTDVAGKMHAMLPMSIGALEALGTENRADDGAWDLLETVARYSVPLLILKAGVESAISDRDLATVEARGGPNVTVRTFETEGHNLHRDAFADFAGIVEAFSRP